MSDAQTYLAHITAYEREFSKWERRVEKILKIYKDEGSEKRNGSRFNILWSNVQTLKSATFSRMPRPDVSRRFKDNDPVGRVAALMLERALEFEVAHYKDFGASLRQAVYDRFIGGRGVAWVRYEPTFRQVQSGVADGGPTLTEDAETQTQVAEELDFECAPVDYVHWKDFGHNVARSWEEVTIVWRKVYLTKAQLERLGEEFEKVPLDAMPDDQSKVKGTVEPDNVQKRALIFEIWDKDTGKCVFLSKSLSEIIKEQDDPLKLEEFFPCPPGLYATLTTDSLVPIPDYTLYQDQARELDTLADRIDGLVQALKVIGVYDSSVPELARLFTEGTNGDLIPVKNWAAFAEKQGLKGAIDTVDILPLAQALSEAYKAFEQIKGQIYELTGISDIIRGETAPSETATAQQIKNNYASMRLKTYQDEVERFATRLLQLKAQIICNHFDERTICEISGCDQLSPEDKTLIPQAVALLKNNVTRNFRIEVETDSMSFQEEQQDKQDAVEFVSAVGDFIQKSVQAPPTLAPMLGELLKFAMRRFRVGKTIEGTIDQVLDQLKQQAQQPQPNPDAQKAQAQLQATQVQEQSAQAQTMAKEQAETQRQAMQHQHERQMAAIDAQRDAQLQALQQHHDAQMQVMQQQHAEAMDKVQNMLQLILQRMKDSTTLEVAEMANQTTLQTAQISAAKQSDSE
jgi:hypothetical protein